LKILPIAMLLLAISALFLHALSKSYFVPNY